jgi:metallophosphoesterase superfamily enzyme
VILGDLIHDRDGRIPEVSTAFDAWRSEHDSLDILLIRGNHDIRAGDPPGSWRMRAEDEPFSDAGDAAIAFAHHPAAAREGSPTLCGHIHPAVLLSGTMHALRAPCFRFSERCGVLPAFGAFTGFRIIEPSAEDRVIAAGPDQVVDVSADGSSRAARK